MVLEESGVLPNSFSCYKHAENFKLLPHSSGKTTVDFNMIHIQLPNIESILNCSEKELFQPVVMQPAELQQLNEIVERAISGSYTQGIDMNMNVTTLRGKGMYRRSTKWLWITAVIIVFMVWKHFWFVWYKLTNRYCPCVWKCTLKP
jgi:hypothetical protein